MILLVLGGCTGITERHFKDQEILDRAEAIAIDYLRSMYKLNVTITKKEMMPKMAMSWVTVYGYVKGHKEQTFSVSINYETNQKESFIYSQQFKESIASRKKAPIINIGFYICRECEFKDFKITKINSSEDGTNEKNHVTYNECSARHVSITFFAGFGSHNF
ncbi:hypothetical protein KZX70_14090 [Paenibacillus silvae]|nr:hypothetical protein [Paenibacillus silvae]MCK6268669.1 hypothetical protein [Paenibacillus silvae]